MSLSVTWSESHLERASNSNSNGSVRYTDGIQETSVPETTPRAWVVLVQPALGKMPNGMAQTSHQGR